MITKQVIAIIGATGSMGTAISRSLAKGNYRLLLFSRAYHRSQQLAQEILSLYPTADVEAVPCSVQATWEADIIIMAIPYPAQKDIAAYIRPMANQKIVISIANPVDNNITMEMKTSVAEELQNTLPYAKVIKAFNTTFAADFENPVIGATRADVFIAGDDEDALQTVSEMATTIGFNPIIAGKLAVSHILESMQLLLMQLSQKYAYKGTAGWKILHN